MTTKNIPSLDANSLSSLWDGLSPHLIASFFEVAKIGDDAWGRTSKTDPKTVLAPLTDANMEIALNWQSPFEQAGPESKAPALMAMLQSGALQPIVDSVMGKQKDGSAQQKSSEFLTSSKAEPVSPSSTLPRSSMACRR